MKFNPKKVLTVVLTSLFAEFIFIGCSSKNSTFAADLQIAKPATLISQYDPIMRDAAVNANLDWRFLSAIAFAESRFKPDSRSKAGAVGLMQVMPTVVKKQGLTLEDAYDPQTNVSLAVNVIKTIESTLRFGNTPEHEKLKIILAGYNSGIGNLIQARKLAAAAGANHNNWETLKNYGAVNNPETRAFVHKVMNQWELYKNKVQ